MFGRKKSKYDPFFGLAEVKAAHVDLRRGDWTAAQALLATGGDRSLLISMLGEDGVKTAIHEQWAATQQDSMSYTMLARKLTSDAWDVRGSGYAKTVKQDAWRSFGAILKDAQVAVDQAIRLDASNADAWAANVQIGIGRSVGIDTVQAHYERAHAVQPFHASATGSLLQARCDKWFGDHESMFVFARWITGHAAADAPVQWAIARAHYERWASMQEDGVAPSQYFSQPEVFNEIMGTASRFLAATPAGALAPLHHLTALNWFVYALGMANQPSRQIIDECANRIARRPTMWPWIARRGEHGEAYDQFLKMAK